MYIVWGHSLVSYATLRKKASQNAFRKALRKALRMALRQALRKALFVRLRERRAITGANVLRRIQRCVLPAPNEWYA